MEKEQSIVNWSEAAEDLVAAGDTEGAISLLESVLSNFETLISSQSASQLQLAFALTDLAKLYSTKGFSLKADELASRASLIELRATESHTSPYSLTFLFVFFSSFLIKKGGKTKGYIT